MAKVTESGMNRYRFNEQYHYAKSDTYHIYNFCKNTSVDVLAMSSCPDMDHQPLTFFHVCQKLPDLKEYNPEHQSVSAKKKRPAYAKCESK